MKPNKAMQVMAPGCHASCGSLRSRQEPRHPSAIPDRRRSAKIHFAIVMKPIIFAFCLASTVFSQTFDDTVATRTRLLDAGLGNGHPKIEALDAAIKLSIPSQYRFLQEKLLALQRALRRYSNDAEAHSLLQKEAKKVSSAMNKIEEMEGNPIEEAR